MKMTSLVLSALIAMPAFAGAALAERPFDPNKPVVVQRESLSYFALNDAISMADAYGALAEGMHGTFGKFPAHFDAGLHTHTGAYRGIVLKGVMTNPFGSETDPPRMEPGSYWYVPAGMVHSTACVSDEPCEFFFYADSGFDFHPTE